MSYFVKYLTIDNDRGLLLNDCVRDLFFPMIYL